MRVLHNSVAWTSLAAWCLGCATSLIATASEHTFDDAASAERFVRTGVEAKFTHDAAAGIGGGGGLLTGRMGSAGQWVEKEAITDTNRPFEVSVAFKHQTHDNVTGQGLFVGVGPDSDYVPTLSQSSDAADHHLLAALQGGGEEPSTYRLLIQSKAAGQVSNHRGEMVRLQPGSWYRLSLSAAPSGEGVHVQASVHVLDETGRTVASVTEVKRDALPLPRHSDTAAGLHAFFGGQAMTPQRGFEAIDNFVSTAEEPSP